MVEGKVRTRFAPSPTGNLHIGGIRTATYAYALAKHAGGDFILRIEDTDQKRKVEGALEKLIQTLKDFELNWDEYYVQSDRAKKGIYHGVAKKLVDKGLAFYCNCSSKNAKKDGFSKELRDPCRDKNLTDGAIKLKVPENKTVSYYDFVIDKKISWDTNTVSDTTLLKSDGFPTYHLAVVVDDNEMQISHVLRGHDWLPSTPIHLIVYEYLGYKLPSIGHLTDILDPEGGKLSKRKGSVSVDGMIEEGYLPEAIINYVILLGWAPKDNREIFGLDDFVDVFDSKGFQKSNPVFDRKKLDWFNGYYIRQKSDKEIAELVKPFLPTGTNQELLSKVTPIIKERLTKLSDVNTLAGFFFDYKKPDTKLFGENYRTHLENALKVLESIPDFNLELLNSKLIDVVKTSNFKTGDFFMDLRVAVAGSKFTPPINESIVILGKNETVLRIKKSLKL